MKKLLLFTGIFVFSLISVQAQPHRGGMGGPPSGPDFDAAMTKLFGDNTAFSATLEFDSTINGSQVVTPGKIAFLEGKSRFEMNLSELKGSELSPEAAEHMKAMGMDNMIAISRPDKKSAYVIYPGLQAYAEVTPKSSDTGASLDKFKTDVTELGKETVDGHPCIKNKVVVTDDQGTTHESTVWNATDLNKFPVKIESTENGKPMTMIFKDVKLSKPDAAQFEAPAGYTHYDNLQKMMMQEMMKKMGGNVPPMH